MTILANYLRTTQRRSTRGMSGNQRQPGDVVGLCVLLWLAVAWFAPRADAQDVKQTPSGIARLFDTIGVDQHIGAQLPMDIPLRDHTGRDVTLQQYFDHDRPVLLSLVYFECPMLCNMSMDGLLRSLRTLPLKAGKDFTVLTVSFDPREGPALAKAARATALKRYGGSDDTDWQFLTGDSNAIRTLTDAVGFRYEYDEQTGQYAHPATIVVLTPQGRISRYLFGVDYPPRDLKFGLIDASNGNLGTVSDRFVMMCYEYDPVSGKYGLAIITGLRITGVITVFALLGGIWWMLRCERNKNDSEQPEHIPPLHSVEGAD